MQFRGRVLIAELKNAWPTWLALVGLIASFFLGWLFSSTTAAAIRYSGMLLQFLGLALVATGLSELRSFFGRPSLREKLYKWLQQVAAAFRPPKPISLKAADTMHLTTSLDAVLIRKAGPDTPLEKRVSILEENLDRLREELDDKVKRLRQDVGKLRQEINSESEARRAENQKLNKSIEKVAVGGLHLEYIGVLWLFLGIIASTIPDELAALYLWALHAQPFAPQCSPLPREFFTP